MTLEHWQKQQMHNCAASNLTDLIHYELPCLSVNCHCSNKTLAVPTKAFTSHLTRYVGSLPSQGANPSQDTREALLPQWRTLKCSVSGAKPQLTTTRQQLLQN